MNTWSKSKEWRDAQTVFCRINKFFGTNKCKRKGCETKEWWINVCEFTLNSQPYVFLFQNCLFNIFPILGSAAIFNSTFFKNRMTKSIRAYEKKYSRIDQVKFVEDSLQKIWRRPYSFKFFKGCLPQIFLSPFLNTLYSTCLRDCC